MSHGRNANKINNLKSDKYCEINKKPDKNKENGDETEENQDNFCQE